MGIYLNCYKVVSRSSTVPAYHPITQQVSCISTTRSLTIIYDFVLQVHSAGCRRKALITMLLLKHDYAQPSDQQSTQHQMTWLYRGLASGEISIEILVRVRAQLMRENRNSPGPLDRASKYREMVLCNRSRANNHHVLFRNRSNDPSNRNIQA